RRDLPPRSCDAGQDPDVARERPRNARPAQGERLSTLVRLALAVVVFGLASVATAATVTLPIEVVGENGTDASVTVEVPASRAREIRSLWMQIHGLNYADMVSVQLNAG